MEFTREGVVAVALADMNDDEDVVAGRNCWSFRSAEKGGRVCGSWNGVGCCPDG